MKNLLSAVLAVVLVSCACAPLVPDAPLCRGAIQVRTDSAAGSGTVISCVPLARKDHAQFAYRIRVLTAKHVVAESRFMIGSEELSPESIETHPMLDLAVVTYLSKHYIRPILLSVAPLRAGQPLWVYGWPAQLPMQIGSGYLGNPNMLEDCIWIAIPNWGGNSGGPVIDAGGRLVGVVIYGMMCNGVAMQNYLGFVPVSEAFDWISERSR